MGPFKEKHPFRQFAEIDLSKTKVSREKPAIFVCGGIVDITSPHTHSVRELFFESISPKGFEDFHDYCIQAETFKDYFEAGKYQDLSLFENDLAHYASLVIIFLESPGSIVELGLFFNTQSLKEKLLVFVNQSHSLDDSFIRLGPLENLERDNNDCVQYYPWDVNNPAGMDSRVLDFIFTDISAAIEKLPENEKFSKENYGHLALLIYECVRIYRALRISEIRSLLGMHGIVLDEIRAKNLIYLLRISGLVEIYKMGKDVFYLPKSDEIVLRLASIRKGVAFETTGLSIASTEYYSEVEGEQRRVLVIEECEAQRGKQNVVN